MQFTEGFRIKSSWQARIRILYENFCDHLILCDSEESDCLQYIFSRTLIKANLLIVIKQQLCAVTADITDNPNTAFRELLFENNVRVLFKPELSTHYNFENLHLASADQWKTNLLCTFVGNRN